MIEKVYYILFETKEDPADALEVIEVETNIGKLPAALINPKHEGLFINNAKELGLEPIRLLTKDEQEVTIGL